METITISVHGEELELLNIELTKEEVAALYKLRKEQVQKISDLEKLLESEQKSKKFAEESRDAAKSELEQGHTLLTALGVADKTSHEESYYRRDLHISTRIALYIAKSTK